MRKPDQTRLMHLAAPARRPLLRRLGLLPLMGVPGLALARKPERQPVTIAVAGKGLLNVLPLTIAEQLGYFDAEGLHASVVDYAGAAKAVQAVLAGNADVVSGNYEHTISMQAKHRPMRAFVLQARTPQIVVGVSRKALPDYRSWADLRGRRIGVTAVGSSTQMVVQALLNKAGVALQEVSLIPVGASSGAVAALRAGQIDALANLDPVVAILQRDAELKVIADLRTVRDTQELFGGPMPGACLYAPADYLGRNRAVVLAITRAMLRALRWLQAAGPSDVVRAVPEPYLLGDRAMYLDAWLRSKEAYSLDGLMPDAAAKTALRALQGFDPGLRDAAARGRALDLSQTYTNDFVKAAMARR